MMLSDSSIGSFQEYHKVHLCCALQDVIKRCNWIAAFSNYLLMNLPPNQADDSICGFLFFLCLLRFRWIPSKTIYMGVVVSSLAVAVWVAGYLSGNLNVLVYYKVSRFEFCLWVYNHSLDVCQSGCLSALCDS